jgi:hypothetical protein
MNLFLLTLGLTFSLVGILITLGTARKWKFFIHPLNRVWKFKIYSFPEIFIRNTRFDNEKTYYYCNLFQGIFFILFGIFFLIKAYIVGNP